MAANKRFRVSEAPPATQAFIRNLFRGITRYFPLPEETSWEELKRVQYWKAFDAPRRRLEREWGPKMATLLEAAGKEIGRVYQETQSEARVDLAIQNRMIPPLRELMRKCILETEREYLGRLKDSFQLRKEEDPFSQVTDPMDLPEMVQWNQDNLGRKITNISESTRTKIREIINQGQSDGRSVSDIVDSIESSFPFSRYRGFLIARTEVIAASNSATHFGMQKLVPKDQMKKDWLATGDKRTRPTHIRAGNSQKDVDFDKPFEVGGSLLMFPGDGSLNASAKETIQCRCTTLYWSKVQPALPTPPIPEVLPPLPRPPAPPKPIRKPKPLSATAAAEAEGKALRQEIEALFGDEIKELQEVAERAMVTHKTWMDMASSLWREGRGPRGEEFGIFQKQRRDLRNRIWGHLALSNPTKSNYRVVFDKASRGLLGSGMEGEIQSVVNFLNSILPGGHKWSNKQIRFHGLKKGARAYANDKGVFLASDAATKTIFHEIGHRLEAFDTKLRTGAKNHLKKRAGSSAAEKLKNLFPGTNYDDWEVAWKDKFQHAYMGKHYRNATELTSMGLEWLWDDPVSFMRKDPAMFDRIIGLLRRKP